MYVCVKERERERERARESVKERGIEGGRESERQEAERYIKGIFHGFNNVKHISAQHYIYHPTV